MPTPDWLLHTPIAHRGLHDDERPENSLPAFEAAASHGYAIEMDVQLSQDGQIVVFHDFSARRMTGHDSAIADLTLAQLKKETLLGTACAIPTLDEVLETVAGRTPLLIEIKNMGRTKTLEQKLCARLKDYRGEFAIQSFNPFSLGAVKKLAPAFSRGLLASRYKDLRAPFYEKFILRHFLLNAVSSPLFIAYNAADLPERHVARFRRKGTPVLGWTVRTEAGLQKARQYCDNIIFENIRP